MSIKIYLVKLSLKGEGGKKFKNSQHGLYMTPGSPSNGPRNSPRILLFRSIERQIAARKANESKNWSNLKVQAVIPNLFAWCSRVT